ncbi:YitT family protein [Paenibacillaceae bacterium T2]|uniref:YitT family protein n=1 Tax=Ferviditalea candida TaxID=3108399 RepID=A0ABU5ZJV9_9BACL|nr:YitT family protein [Paenibacillaceae bacterium T2]
MEESHRGGKNKKSWIEYTARYLFIALGALLVAVGLELFLMPNDIIDGGIIGLSMIFSHISGLQLAIFIFIFNLPFMVIGYKQIGKTFALNTLASVALLSLFSLMVHGKAPLTEEPMLASIFGGIILGIGVGTIIRNGGALDGTEIIAIIATKKTGFSVGEIVMFFNIFILGSAGFVFEWDSAMYSLITYFIAFKSIDTVIEGLDESKSVTIISNKPDEISSAIIARLGRGVTHVYGKGGYTGEEKELLYCIVTRLEVAKLKSIVHEHDPEAFIAIEHVADVMGGRFSKRAIH